ncbi:MAG: hypothetical protein ABI237_05535 [Ginsengibacter sp.]
MKYYKQIGILACLLLIVSSFLPFAYYPDLHQSFTGFYSEKNIYGKPGKVFIFFAVISVILIYVDKIWAKRTNIFIAAFNIGYLVKTYILFTSCYNAICPEKKYGLYLLIAGSALLMLTALLPDMKLKPEEDSD